MGKMRVMLRRNPKHGLYLCTAIHTKFEHVFGPKLVVSLWLNCFPIEKSLVRTRKKVKRRKTWGERTVVLLFKIVPLQAHLPKSMMYGLMTGTGLPDERSFTSRYCSTEKEQKKGQRSTENCCVDIGMGLLIHGHTCVLLGYGRMCHGQLCNLQ